MSSIDPVELKFFYKLIRDVLLTIDDFENDEVKIDSTTLAELQYLKKEAQIQNKDLETFIDERLIRLGADIRPNLKKELSKHLK
jgi:hypothetical protein